MPGLPGASGLEGFKYRGEVGARGRLGWDTGEFGREKGDDLRMTKSADGPDEEEHPGEVVAIAMGEAEEKGEGILATRMCHRDQDGAERAEVLGFRLGEEVADAVEGQRLYREDEAAGLRC